MGSCNSRFLNVLKTNFPVLYIEAPRMLRKV